MITCTGCKRLFRNDEKLCPFCGADAGMTRRQAGLAAAALLIAPAALAAQQPKPADQDPKPAYGVPRPVEVEPAVPAAIEALTRDWLPSVGILDHASTWVSKKVGTTVSFAVSQSAKRLGASTGSLTIRLVKAEKDAVELSLESRGMPARKQKMTPSSGFTDDARVVSEAKETVEVDGTKFECVAKSCEMPGRAFKVWWCKDAPYGVVKVEMDKETTRLVKVKESVKVAAGTYDCSVWETTDGTKTRRVWRSDSVPGAIVKMVETDPTENGEVKVTAEVSAVKDGK
jgi:hypothetical protein